MKTANMLISELKDVDEVNLGVVALLSSRTIYGALVVSWTSVARRLNFGSPFEAVPDAIPKEDHLRWLWSRVEPEPNALWAEAAGLPNAVHVRRAMNVLRDNCAIFPDGKMSQWAHQWLRAQAAFGGVKIEQQIEQQPLAHE